MQPLHLSPKIPAEPEVVAGKDCFALGPIDRNQVFGYRQIALPLLAELGANHRHPRPSRYTTRARWPPAGIEPAPPELYPVCSVILVVSASPGAGNRTPTPCSQSTSAAITLHPDNNGGTTSERQAAHRRSCGTESIKYLN
jgi:hypothetical protein